MAHLNKSTSHQKTVNKSDIMDPVVSYQMSQSSPSFMPVTPTDFHRIPNVAYGVLGYDGNSPHTPINMMQTNPVYNATGWMPSAMYMGQHVNSTAGISGGWQYLQQTVPQYPPPPYRPPTTQAQQQTIADQATNSSESTTSSDTRLHVVPEPVKCKTPETFYQVFKVENDSDACSVTDSNHSDTASVIQISPEKSPSTDCTIDKQTVLLNPSPRSINTRQSVGVPEENNCSSSNSKDILPPMPKLQRKPGVKFNNRAPNVSPSILHTEQETIHMVNVNTQYTDVPNCKRQSGSPYDNSLIYYPIKTFVSTEDSIPGIDSDKLYPDDNFHRDNLSYRIVGGRYSCNQCYYATPRPDKIVQHLKAHNGKWQCTLCGKAFIKNCDLYRHNIAHANGRIRMKTPEVIIDTALNAEGKIDHLCSNIECCDSDKIQEMKTPPAPTDQKSKAAFDKILSKLAERLVSRTNNHRKDYARASPASAALRENPQDGVACENESEQCSTGLDNSCALNINDSESLNIQCSATESCGQEDFSDGPVIVSVRGSTDSLISPCSSTTISSPPSPQKVQEVEHSEPNVCRSTSVTEKHSSSNAAFTDTECDAGQSQCSQNVDDSAKGHIIRPVSGSIHKDTDCTAGNVTNCEVEIDKMVVLTNSAPASSVQSSVVFPKSVSSDIHHCERSNTKNVTPTSISTTDQTQQAFHAQISMVSPDSNIGCREILKSPHRYGIPDFPIEKEHSVELTDTRYIPQASSMFSVFSSHDGKERLLCKHCSYATSSEIMMGKHIKAHFDVRRICRFCHKAFERLYDLRNHETRHLPGYRCEKSRKSKTSRSMSNVKKRLKNALRGRHTVQQRLYGNIQNKQQSTSSSVLSSSQMLLPPPIPCLPPPPPLHTKDSNMADHLIKTSSIPFAPASKYQPCNKISYNLNSEITKSCAELPENQSTMKPLYETRVNPSINKSAIDEIHIVSGECLEVPVRIDSYFKEIITSTQIAQCTIIGNEIKISFGDSNTVLDVEQVPQVSNIQEVMSVVKKMQEYSSSAMDIEPPELEKEQQTPSNNIISQDPKVVVNGGHRKVSNRPIIEKKEMLLSKLQCEQCSSNFSSASLLQRHILNEHNIKCKKVKLAFPCPECCDAFATQTELDRHQSWYHPEVDVVIFTCKICDRDFDNQGSLRRHKFSHRRMNKRKALKASSPKCEKSKCPTCGKYVSKPYLENHMARHTEDLRCKSCGQIFNMVGLLRNHKNKCKSKQNTEKQ